MTGMNMEQAGAALDEVLTTLREVAEEAEGDFAAVVARLIAAAKIWVAGESAERMALRAVAPAELVGLLVTQLIQEIEMTPVGEAPQGAPPSTRLEERWATMWSSLPAYARLPRNGIGLIARMVCDEFPDPGDAGVVADILIRRLAPQLDLPPG